MKLTKYVAAVAAVSAALTLAACSSDDENAEATSSVTTTTTVEAAPAALPTAEELNGILALAADPNQPIEERVQTVDGGETAPELFDLLAANQAETGTTFTVVEPILSFTPESVLATVIVQNPGEAEPQKGEDVEFVYVDGRWKLSKTWACMIVGFVVPPEQVPAMCQEINGVAPVEGDPAAEVPAEAPVEEAPVEAPVEEAPAEAPAQ